MRSGAGASRRQRGSNHFAADTVWIATVGALDAFVRGSERRIDLAGVDGRVFVNNASVGVYAKIVQPADYRDATAETVARMVPGLLPIRGERFDLRFAPPGGTCWDGAGLLLVSKSPCRPPRPGTNGARDVLDTHVLSIIAVRAVKPRELVTLLPPEPPARALGTGGCSPSRRRRSQSKAARSSRLPSMASPLCSTRRSSSRRVQRRCGRGAGPPTCFASAKTTVPARSTEYLVPFPAAERASYRTVRVRAPRGPQF
jgi:hypothetical protein